MTETTNENTAEAQVETTPEAITEKPAPEAKADAKKDAKAEAPKRNNRDNKRGDGKGRDNRGGNRDGDREESDLVEKLVAINRVAKVVKGGRRFGFAALMVVGDGRGRVGFGSGKAKEVPEAIRKASESARKNMIRVALREGRTLHHDVKGHFGAGKVLLRAAEPGTGIIAGGPTRAVFEALGVQDVVAKSNGTSNPYNMIKAAFDGLKHCSSPRQVAARRGLKVSDIVSRRDGVDAKDAKEETANG